MKAIYPSSFLAMHSILSSYNFPLVILSIVIAISASYTAIDVAARITVAKGRAQVTWLCCGAVAMGIGIWAMHFVGMLALRLPFMVEYDFRTVAISVLPAVLASGLSLFIVSRPTLGWARLTGGSLLMGGGIASMHYVGMAAMRMPAITRYSEPWVAISVLIAIAVSFIGLSLVFRLRADSAHQLRKRLFASVAMGLAIPTMHYTGMAAARFIPSDASGVLSLENLRTAELRPPANGGPLATAVIISVAIIFSIAWTSTFLDRLKGSELQFKALAEKEELLNKKLRESEAQQRQKNEQLKEALRALKSVQVQLIQSEKMSSMGQLVAGVAHEINNPVNFIYGNLQHVKSYTRDLSHLITLYQQHYPEPVEAIEAYVDEIDLDFIRADFEQVISSMSVGTQRIREIVLSLRNFSRMDESALKTVDVHEGINNTLMILRHRLKSTASSPAIEVIRDYDALPKVDCYPGQLNQVFMNILANALDALETVSENPTITIRTCLSGNDWIEIAIADNGPGIPDAIRSHIFDPFFTTKPVGKGTGMGLSISYRIIVEGHGGKLECLSPSEQGTSKQGTSKRGTEFLIQIPTCQPEDSSD